jgi:hypothetical protein
MKALSRSNWYEIYAFGVCRVMTKLSQLNLCQRLAWPLIQRKTYTSFIMHMLEKSGLVSRSATLNIILFAYVEIWLMLILMLICYERKTLFVGWKVVKANMVIEQMVHYLRSTLFAVMKVTRTLIQYINKRKSVLQQGHAVMLVSNSMCH